MQLSKQTLEVALDLLKAIIISPTEDDAKKKFEMSHNAVTEIKAALAALELEETPK